MEKAKISPIQLFSLIYLFELGSAIVVAVGISAKKDAWIAILLGLIGGIFLFFIYRYLYLQYPATTLTGYAKKIFGNYLGSLIGLFYIIYFLNISMRVLRDFGDLLLASTLPKTPLLPINMLMILAVSYVLFHGIEVLGRTAEVFIVILLFLGISGNLLIHISGNVNYNHLMPVFAEGWKPIVTTTFPETLAIPFGEVIVFTMLLPYLNKQKMITKTVLSAMILSGLTLSYTLALNVAVLGVDQVGRSTFPLLATIGMVNIAEFLQRLDVIVVFTLIIGGFFKIAIFFYAGLIGIVDLFQFKSHTKMILPVAIIVSYGSMAIASNFIEHIEEGLKIFAQSAHITFQMIIPLLMLIITIIRKRLESKEKFVF
jgi:spore germination protein KB